MPVQGIPPNSFCLMIEYASMYGSIYARVPVTDDTGEEDPNRQVSYIGQAQFGSAGQVRLERFEIRGAATFAEAIAQWPSAISTFLEERAAQERKIIVADGLPPSKIQ